MKRLFDLCIVLPLTVLGMLIVMIDLAFSGEDPSDFDTWPPDP